MALKGTINSYVTLFAVTVTILFVKDSVHLKQKTSQEFPEFYISKADQLTPNLFIIFLLHLSTTVLWEILEKIYFYYLSSEGWTCEAEAN